MTKPIRLLTVFLLTGGIGIAQLSGAQDKLSYPVVDTAQIRCYDDQTEIAFPTKPGEAFFGQDAQYAGNEPKYRDNGDGTVSDLVTGLMWQKDPGEKMTLNQALAGANACRTGGYTDWRMPTIKELYSLIIFSGTDPDPMTTNTANLKPFIDTRYFNLTYGDEQNGERIIDCQYASSTLYVSTTMGGNKTMFGVNFVDGRIKGYPGGKIRGKEKTYYVIYVRGNKAYGQNHFTAGPQGTVIDKATGLTWMRVDSGALKAGKNKDGKMNWREALAWSEGLSYGGHSDWRLPNAKELQSIVDYTRSPATTGSAALDPLFNPTQIIDEGGKKNFPFYWTSSTHAGVRGGSAADYIAFGEALGWMRDPRTGERALMDVHGAGAQRSDPKSGDPKQFPYGRGPQGDVLRIYNYVLCVRGGAAEPRTTGPKVEIKRATNQRGGQRGGGQGGEPSFLSRLDKDGDGKVSKAEFDGPQKHFSHFDKNGDGYIADDEAPKGPPEDRRN